MSTTTLRTTGDVGDGPGAPPTALVVDKGLKPGTIGLLGSTVLGVVQTAPAYSLAVTLGLLAATVGAQSPALVVLGFLPILCITIMQRAFLRQDPDCGTLLVWVGRSLGPSLGWLTSWTAQVATLIALANLALVTGSYAFLTIGADSLADSAVATTAVGLVWLAGVTLLALRGIEISSRLQTILLVAGMGVLGVFTAVALVKVAAGSAGDQAINPALDWLNPGSVDGSGALSAGLLLTIFLFWGWDGPSSVVEEADEAATPRKAIALSVGLLLGFYLLSGIAVQAYAGVGADGIGLGNEDNAGDVLGVVGSAAIGSWFGTLMEIAVLTSAAACLAAAIVPSARALLAMGAYRALPETFATVDRRTGAPVAGTIAISAGSGLVLIALQLVSQNVLADAIGALGLLIALYYTIFGLGYLWAFRARILGGGARALLLEGLLPLAGTAVLAWAFVRTLKDTYATDYGSTTILGVGGVFAIGVVAVGLGVAAMLAWRLRAPAFFRGETFAPDYVREHRPDLVGALGDG
jgi:amino acid transporter